MKGRWDGAAATIVVNAMRDGLILRSLPFFGGLTILPGCTNTSGSNDTSSTTDASTSAEGGATTSTGLTDATTGIGSATDATAADSTTGVGATTGDPNCAGTCAAPPPEGWFGPTIYARLPDASTLPDCPDEYPNPGPTLLEGFHDPGPAQCDCSCTLMAGTPCSGTLRLYDSACAGYGWYTQQATENCTNYALVDRGIRVYSYNYGTPGTCQKEASELIPPVAWDGAIRSCRVPETPLSCNDGAGVCLSPAPEGFESAWCIYKQGDVECPGGDFGNKFVFNTNAMDTRECSSCSCGTAGTSCNEGVIQLFDDIDCAGMPSQELPIDGGGACTVISADSFAATFSDGPPCPVTSIPEPTGSVEAVGPFTFCCG